MGSNRRNNYANRCLRCRVFYKLCFCDFIPELEIQTPIQIIMHHKEKNLSSNSAYLMREIHPKSKIYYRGERDWPVDYKKLAMEDTHTPLFLFPSSDAVEIDSQFLKGLSKPINLIVPDGSWRQAKKFKRRIPEFDHIQSIKLPGHHVSQYLLRSAPQSGMLSTFEAMAKILGILEGEDLQEQLESAFRVMVKRVSMSRLGEVL